MFPGETAGQCFSRNPSTVTTATLGLQQWGQTLEPLPQLPPRIASKDRAVCLTVASLAGSFVFPDPRGQEGSLQGLSTC